MADKTLKLRYHDGDDIAQVRIANSSTREEVHAAIQAGPCDLIYIDAQHGACTDWDVTPREYADWWNQNGNLGFKIESLSQC